MNSQIFYSDYFFRDEVLHGERMVEEGSFRRNKRNYGMRDLDPVLEELTGNKL